MSQLHVSLRPASIGAACENAVNIFLASKLFDDTHLIVCSSVRVENKSDTLGRFRGIVPILAGA